ncbi:MAG TPA: DNA polymerase III subunit gamma/tau [Candidatus Saccharimonadales bacterium]|nr:DNA polymerase III subunit gamma/tau [Candidatus Saccharimonadales bacterium]
MGQALYRTYRSKKLSEIVGQEHITDALSRALQKGTVSHAYLFTGPRGVGKTSIARILAHEINGLPYQSDATNLDIIEIDAASNRRIDEIRDLRDKVHIAPTSAKYKVYIIDEVHMLTKEAFNALLKTLEEPPAHVVFILATTEAHKLPETIISRTQRFAFKPVDPPKVISHLKYIAGQEKITIDDDALALIAAHGEGSFRDSISLLDQIRNTGDKVTLADVQAVLGIAPKELIEQLLDALANHDPVSTAGLLQKIHHQGHEPAQIARQIGTELRQQLLDGAATLPSDQLLVLLAKLIEIPASADPRSLLEIALLDTALAAPGVQGTPQQKTTQVSKVMHESVRTKPEVQVEPHPSTFHKTEQKASAAPKGPPEKPPAAASDTSAAGGDKPITPNTNIPIDQSIWPDILAAIKQRHNTLYSIVRATRPNFEPGIITLECGYAFHQKRLNETRNKQVLSELITQVTGQDIQLQCVVGEALGPDEAISLPPALPPATNEVVHTVQKTPAAGPVKQLDPTVATISNIFGGAEVLES